MRDWPLTLCDASTVVAENDLEPADLVYADYVIENCQVYHTARQKWYYLRDQTPSEAWVFRQTDSRIGSCPGEFPQLREENSTDNSIRSSTLVIPKPNSFER